MKKLLAVLVCLMMALSLFSCDTTDQKDEETATTNNQEDEDGTATTTDEKVEETTEAVDGSSSPLNDLAMQMFEAAIKGEISVCDAHLGETELKNLQFPSDGTRLEECKQLTKAILDMDGDGVNEYVLQSPDRDHIVLHCYNGKVYSYCFDRDDFCNLSTDGTFYWNNSSIAADWKGGLNQIVFDGETVYVKSVYSIHYSEKTELNYYEADYYDYYVNGEAVTRSEFSDLRLYKTKMRFTPFELTCSYPITAEQAWDFANTYWDHMDGAHDGAVGTLAFYRVVVLDTPNSDMKSYRIGLQMEFYSNWDVRKDCMPPRNSRIDKQILVDAKTGEITEYVAPEADGK